MARAFVTGTDTGVGKTWVTAGLLAAARRRGLRAVGFKPVESGVADGDSSDADLLASDAGLYKFEAPLAPGVAAEQLGQSIDFDRIRQRTCQLGRDADLVLVEGVGGILVPLGQGRTVLDLAGFLDLPLLIVARPDLGTINHTALTIEVAKTAGLTVLGAVFSQRDPRLDAGFVASNAREIERITGVRVLGTAPPVEPILARLLRP